MARPAKAVGTMSKHLTKDEIANRTSEENKVTPNKKPSPPSHLTDEQKAIFNFICNELEESKILCSLDNFVLATCAIAVDRLNYIENRINASNGEMFEKDVMTAKDKYTKDFFRCCNELCLSPQSRAKIALANANAAKDAADPLMEVLKGLKK